MEKSEKYCNSGISGKTFFSDHELYIHIRFANFEKLSIFKEAHLHNLLDLLILENNNAVMTTMRRCKKKMRRWLLLGL